MPLISRNKCLDILNEPLIYINNGRDCLIPESNVQAYYSWVENREPSLPDDMEVGAVFDPVDSVASSIDGYVVKYKQRDSYNMGICQSTNLKNGIYHGWTMLQLIC